MKEEALKLAEDLLDRLDSPRAIIRTEASAMIRRLVEELDKQTYKAELLKNRLKVIVGSKPTITKLDGKVVAVTMTDDEHRITEVLWEAPKPLSDEEIKEVEQQVDKQYAEDLIYRQDEWVYLFAKAIEERHGIK